MKIKKKHIELFSGFVRLKNDFEINWNLRSFALLLGIEVTEHLVFLDILCVSLIFTRKQ